jgi:hypothetical protein
MTMAVWGGICDIYETSKNFHAQNMGFCETKIKISCELYAITMVYVLHKSPLLQNRLQSRYRFVNYFF